MDQSPRPCPSSTAATVRPVSQSSSLALRKSPLARAGLGSRDTRPGMHPSCFKYSLGLQGLCCALTGWWWGTLAITTCCPSLHTDTRWQHSPLSPDAWATPSHPWGWMLQCKHNKLKGRERNTVLTQCGNLPLTGRFGESHFLSVGWSNKKGWD